MGGEGCKQKTHYADLLYGMGDDRVICRYPGNIGIVSTTVYHLQVETVSVEAGVARTGGVHLLLPISVHGVQVLPLQGAAGGDGALDQVVQGTGNR